MQQDCMRRRFDREPCSIARSLEILGDWSRYEYELTAKGKDLFTAITVLRQWGDRWVFGAGHEPLLVIDQRTGRPLPPVRVLGEDGRPIPREAMAVVPGPGHGPPASKPRRRGARAS
jgi:hypothetical protein